VNIAKAQLEGLFVDELERLQPTPGYMRLLKESILTVWHERKSAVRHELEDVERKAKAIQQKLDRLDEAFIFARAIDSETYERQRDRLREELTLIQIDRHTTELEELDVEGNFGVCGTSAAEGVRTVGSRVARPAATVAAAVFSGGSAVRRKRL
jgi:hypothetical protein